MCFLRPGVSGFSGLSCRLTPAIDSSVVGMCLLMAGENSPSHSQPVAQVSRQGFGSAGTRRRRRLPLQPPERSPIYLAAPLCRRKPGGVTTKPWVLLGHGPAQGGHRGQVHGSNHVDTSASAIRGVALACLLHQAGHECELTGSHPQTNNRMELKAAMVCIWRRTGIVIP